MSADTTPTRRRYVGACHGSPFGRWAEHVSKLRNGNHTSMFQSEWDAYPSLGHWRFEILQVVEPKVSLPELHHIEAGHIIQVGESMRLNSPNRTVIRAEKKARVVQMLKQGCRYVDIRDECDISLGMISKIKRATLAS